MPMDVDVPVPTIPVPVPGLPTVPLGLAPPPLVAFLLVVGNESVEAVKRLLELELKTKPLDVVAATLLKLELVIKPLEVVAGTLDEFAKPLEDDTVSPGQVKTFEKLSIVSFDLLTCLGSTYLVIVTLVVSTNDVMVPVTTVS